MRVPIMSKLTSRLMTYRDSRRYVSAIMAMASITQKLKRFLEALVIRGKRQQIVKMGGLFMVKAAKVVSKCSRLVIVWSGVPPMNAMGKHTIIKSQVTLRLSTTLKLPIPSKLMTIYSEPR